MKMRNLLKESAFFVTEDMVKRYAEECLDKLEKSGKGTPVKHEKIRISEAVVAYLEKAYIRHKAAVIKHDGYVD